MKYLLITIAIITINSCTLDNKKGGTFIYSIINNATDKNIFVKAYSENIMIDSFSISSYTSSIDTAFDGNGKQESYFSEFTLADSIALIFNNEEYINYTVFFNPEPNYNLINNKNILGVGWEEIERHSEKKTTYITIKFSITEQDYLLADSL